MQMFSAEVTDLVQLQSWLAQQEIAADRQILVQIYSSQGSRLSRQYSRAIRQYWPDSTVLAASFEQSFVNARLLSQTTQVSVTVFAKTRLKAVVQPLSEDLKTDGGQLFRDLVTPDTRAVIAIACGIDASGTPLFEAFNHADRRIPVAGGIAMPTAAANGPWVMLNEEIHHNGVVAVGLQSTHLRIWYDAFKQEFAVGRRFRVNRAQGNRIYLLDGLTPYAIYCHYLSDDQPVSAELLREIPLIHTDEIDGAMISPVRLFEDGSIEFSHPPAAGARLQFCFSHPSLTHEHICQGANTLAAQRPEAIFLFNCSGRSVLADGNPELELHPFADIAPTSGAYCYGEFFRQDQQTILAQSLTYLALSESEAEPTAAAPETPSRQNSLSPLFKLIANSLIDLEQLNAQLEQKVLTRTKELLDSYRTDSLTGLPNHQAFSERLQSGQPIAQLFAIKLPELEALYEQFGYDVVDPLLSEISQKIKVFFEQASFVEADVFANMPGEWMVAIEHCPDTASLTAQVQAFLEQLRAHPFEIRPHGQLEQLKIQLCAGMASEPGTHTANQVSTQLMRAASQACRRARTQNITLCCAAEPGE